MNIFGWLRQLRHPFAQVLGLIAFVIGVLGLSVPGWRVWLTSHALAGWILAVALVAAIVFGYALLDQHVLKVETDHELMRKQLAEAETAARSAAEALAAAKAEPSPNDRRLFAEWQEEYPDTDDWRYNLRLFNAKHFTSEFTGPMYALAHGHWSHRHFTDDGVERAFRGVVVAAQRFEDSNGPISEHRGTRGDVAYYTIMKFSESNGGEARYRAEIDKTSELAEAVAEAIDIFEEAARNRRL